MIEMDVNELQQQLLGITIENKPTDLTIQAGGQQFEVHRDILTSHLRDSQSRSQDDKTGNNDNLFKIDDISASTMSAIIEFMYTNSCKFNTEDVQDILRGALRLKIDKLITECENFISRHIGPNNCLAIATFAQRHDLDNLLNYAVDVCLRYFEQLIEQREFLEISQTLLMRLIVDDKLDVTREQKVLEAIINWFIANPDKDVKFEDFAAEVRLTEGEIRDMRDTFRDGEEEHLSRQKDLIDLAAQCLPSTFSARSPPTKQRILVFGYHPDTRTIIEEYNLLTDEWTEHKEVGEKGAYLLSAAFLENSVFVATIDTSKVSLYRYDLETREYNDVSLFENSNEAPNMKLIAHAGKLYAFYGTGSGYGKQRVVIVKCYDPFYDVWSDCSHYNANSLTPLDVVGDRIYVYGWNQIGYHDDMDMMSGYFDPGRGAWDLSHFKFNLDPRSVVHHKGKLFGWDRTNWYEGMFTEVDLALDRSTVSSLSDRREALCFISTDRYLYAMGINSDSWHHDDEHDRIVSRLVESYDPSTSLWQRRQSMSRPKYELLAVSYVYNDKYKLGNDLHWI